MRSRCCDVRSVGPVVLAGPGGCQPNSIDGSTREHRPTPLGTAVTRPRSGRCRADQRPRPARDYGGSMPDRGCGPGCSTGGHRHRDDPMVARPGRRDHSGGQGLRSRRSRGHRRRGQGRHRLPLGWPGAFVEFVSAHHVGHVAPRDDLAARTDAALWPTGSPTS